MAATATVAARIDPDLKSRSQAILQRSGITDSQIIRRVYEYIAFLDEVPEFLLIDSYRISGISGKRMDRPSKFQRMVNDIESNPASEAILGATDADLSAALNDAYSDRLGKLDE